MGIKLPFGDIGPCEIVWGYGESAPINLSPFLGSVELKQTDTIKDVQEEGFGEAAVDAVFGGGQMELDVPMTRSTLQQLEAVLLGQLAGSVLTLNGMVGCDMYASAKAMVIKPVCDNVASTDHATWINLFKTHPYRKWALQFDRSNQRVFLVGFKIFISQDSLTFGQFGTIGMV
jgi:hypothetical protein